MSNRWFRHPLIWVALFFVALPGLARPVGISVATEVVIFALYAIAFNLLLGYTGVVSFGHALFFGLGAYATGLLELKLQIPSLPALIMAAVIAFAAAIFVGLIIINKLNIYFALLTLAFTQLAYEIVFRWSTFTGGEVGLQGITRSSIFGIDLGVGPAFYVFVALISWLCIAAIWWLVNTPFGHVLQGIRENEQRCRLLGCNTALYKLLAFGLSAFFSGVAGGLDGMLLNAAYPQSFGWEEAGIILMITYLGGRRVFFGPILGAFIYLFGRFYINTLTEHWMLVLGSIFIAIILIFPDGLAMLFPKRWSYYLNRSKASKEVAMRGTRNKEEQGGTLSITDLSKSFGANQVADSLGLDIERNRVTGLLGPNGAGKTTLFNMLSGLLQPDSGRILLDGQDITKLGAEKRGRRGLGRSLQIVSTFNGLTVFENVRLAVQLKVKTRPYVVRQVANEKLMDDLTNEVLEKLGLLEVAHTEVAELAYGEQRLVEIAITLAAEPRVLLLDEPLAGLAEEERNVVSNVIKALKNDRTILIIEHDVERLMALADRVVVLHQGRIVADGTPNEIARDPIVSQVYLGTKRDESAVRRGDYKSVETAGKALLQVTNLTAAYGQSKILHNVSLTVREGEVAALLGRNGVGKTTTVMSVGGVVSLRDGSILFDGVDIVKWPAHRIRQAGLGIVPQGRRIFPNLTVAENLAIACVPGNTGKWSVNKVYEVFPRLKEREKTLGLYLSGGEKQLLAIARVLMGPLKVVVLDEPLEGLSPTMAQLVMDAIEKLRDQGIAILLVEQAVELALQLVDNVYVLGNGRIVYSGAGETLRRDTALVHELLGVQ